MKNLYEKNELTFSLLWIGVYVVLMSVADNLSAAVGTPKIITVPACILLTAVLYIWVAKSGLKEKYGLCKSERSAKDFLFYIPMLLLVSTNVWFGLKWEASLLEVVLGIVSMLFVGFLEEIIFRGFLFQAIRKDNLKRAVIISSVTFGFGHIVNLLNGRDTLETLLQVCYACAIGFLFTIVFLKGKSLWSCILTHSLINSLSVVSNKEAYTVGRNVIVSVFLCVASLGYAFYILKKCGSEQPCDPQKA